MKKFILAIVAAVSMAVPAFADDVEGLWQTAPGETGGYLHVKIATCGADICGTIAAAIKADGTSDPAYAHLGKPIIWAMGVDGGGAYSGGKIWAPDVDKTYRSKMSLSGSKLVVKGCVAGGLICRGQDWKRLN